MSQLQVIEYDSQRVLMTPELAVAYGTDSKHLNDNFQNNSKRYVFGKHYFCLEGEELKTFKASTEISGNLKFAPKLMLWTEKGAWMHAKSLNTDKAWEAYDLLVDDYYRIKSAITVVPSYMIDNPVKRAEQWIVEYREKQALAQRIAEDEPKVSYFNQILQSTNTVTITQIAKDYGMSGQALNKILHEEKVQYKQNKQWLLYSRYHDKGYVNSDTTPVKRENGEPMAFMHTHWTQKGRLFIHRILQMRGIDALVDRVQEESAS